MVILVRLVLEDVHDEVEIRLPVVLRLSIRQLGIHLTTKFYFTILSPKFYFNNLGTTPSLYYHYFLQSNSTEANFLLIHGTESVYKRSSFSS